MNGQFVRPSARDMMFCVYGRHLHPELFDTLASRRVERDGYSLVVRVTPSGHVLSWQAGDVYLAELTTTRDHAPPCRGSMLRHRFQGERTGAIPPIQGVSYQMSSQLEILPPEVFVQINDELTADGLRRGLLYLHAPHQRMALSPLSYITVEAWRGTLSVNTFHTFPGEFALLKTQSLIERS
jgi:hypothetical protein